MAYWRSDDLEPDDGERVVDTAAWIDSVEDEEDAEDNVGKMMREMPVMVSPMVKAATEKRPLPWRMRPKMIISQWSMISQTLP